MMYIKEGLQSSFIMSFWAGYSKMLVVEGWIRSILWCEKPQGEPAHHQHVAEVSDRKVTENIFSLHWSLLKERKKCSLFPCKGSNKPFQLLLKYCFEKPCSWWSLKLAFMELIHHINYSFPLNNKQVHQFTMAAIRSANKKIIYIKKAPY